jgi:Fe-S oxidoreductase
MEEKAKNQQSIGLERVKKWLYAKGLGERSAGCVLCGSCYGHGPVNPMEDRPGVKTKCPPYEFYRFQRFTPKSRWLMAQRVFHGLDPITPELKEVLYTCTTCLMCQEICGVRNDGYGPWDITVALREEITAKEGPIEPHRPILEGLRQHDNPWAVPKARRGQWAKGLGLKKLGAAQSATLLFAGCSADLASGRAAAVALAKILKQAGENFVVLGEAEKCCGLYAADLGFRAEYYRLQEENLKLLKGAGIKKVVVACGSCLRSWKDYPKQAMAGIEVLHGLEYVERAAAAGRLQFAKGAPKKITYHDPCHLGRGAGVYEAPRNILRLIPGVELIEMERNQRWSWCCGGGGGVPEAFPELAEWNAGDRLAEAARTGAELLLTSSALCHRSFGQCKKPALPSQELLELISQAI